MKDLMNCADKYIKKCGWRDIALLKICVLALGIMVGLCISPNNKKSALWAAMAVFVVTYIPVMSDFLKFVAEIFYNLL